jgi:hypothetical protein
VVEDISDRLKSAGVVDLIAAATAVSIALSAVYNHAYFEGLNSDLSTWLTVQDLVMGAAFAFVPVLFAIQLFVPFSAALLSGSKVAIIVGLILGAIVASGIVASGVLDWMNYKSVSHALLQGGFVLVFTLSGVVAFQTRQHDVRTVVGLIGAFFAIYTVSAALGRLSYYWSFVGYDTPEVRLVLDAQVSEPTGRILRTTSNYTFLFDGKTVTAFRNEQLRSVIFLKPQGA